MEQTRSSWLSIAAVLFLIWSLLAFAVRVWTKLRRKELLGLDDTTLVAAMVGVTLSAVHNGYGRMPVDMSEAGLATVEKQLYVAQFLYILSMGLSRCSSSFFIRRLTRYKPQVQAAYVLAGVSMLWVVASVLVVALRGNLSAPWETLDGSSALFYRWLGVELSGLLIEFGLWLLAINLIWNLNMALFKRCAIIMAFGSRIFIIPIIAVRLAYLDPGNCPPPLIFSNLIAAILTQAAMHYACVAASVPCLNPLFRPFHSSFLVSNGDSGATTTGDKPRDTYMLLNRAKDRKTKALHSSTSERSNKPKLRQSPAIGSHPSPLPPADDTFRGEFVSIHGSAVAGSDPNLRLDENALQIHSDDATETSENMLIRQTKTFLVSEERVNSP